jgi:hypothetical protein
MKLTRKYEFTNEAAADTAIAALPHDDEGNPTHGHLVVKLGYLTIEPAEYNEEGEETKAAVVSDVYAVDVYWSGEALASWEAFIVWPTPLGIHNFGSSSSRDEYATAYCILFPNSTYCNPPDEEELYTE